MAPSGYGCSFVTKLRWKKKLFFKKKNICVFYKIYIICRKKIFLYQTKILCRKKAITEKKFFSEKNLSKKVCLIGEIYFYSDFHYFLII